MGGLGSGTWERWLGKKTTVEESISVQMRGFRGQIYAGAAGTLTWTWGNGAKASIGYFVTCSNDCPPVPIITLRYRWRDREGIRIRVRLQATSTQFGGRRWWFTCPLSIDGIACERRVGKLYLPPRSRYFGCRRCHGLTYRSCQVAHREERLLTSFGRWLDWLDDQER